MRYESGSAEGNDPVHASPPRRDGTDRTNDVGSAGVRRDAQHPGSRKRVEAAAPAHEPGGRVERTHDVGGKPQLGRQRFDGTAARRERLRAGIDLDAGDADRRELTAHAVGCFDHGHGDAGASEIPRDDQARHPRPDHDDAPRLGGRNGGRLR